VPPWDPAVRSAEPTSALPAAVGIVLAAGAGARAGGPKALRRTPDGVAWLGLAAHALLDGGCREVVAVLGASAADALPLVPPHPAVRAVVAADWAAGVSASLRAGLVAAAETEAAVAVVSLVDLPGLPSAAVARLLAPPSSGSGAAHPAGILRRAVYGSRPGHPVVLGRDWWPALAHDTHGDRGAGAFLSRHGAEAVECGDLWHGEDVDR